MPTAADIIALHAQRRARKAVLGRLDLARAARRTTDVNPSARSVSVEKAGWWSEQLGVPVPAGTPTAALPSEKQIDEVKALGPDGVARYLEARKAVVDGKRATHAEAMRLVRGPAAKKTAPKASKAPASHRQPGDIQGAERRTLATDVAKRYEAARRSGRSHTEALAEIAGSLSYETDRGRDLTPAGARTLVRDLLREHGVDTSARRPAKAAKAPALAARDSTERREAVKRYVRAYTAGASISEIADAAGVSYATVHKDLVLSGAQLRGRGAERRRTSDVQAERDRRTAAELARIREASGREAAPAKAAKAAPRAAFDAAETLSRLRAAKSREEARGIIGNATGTQLAALQRESGSVLYTTSDRTIEAKRRSAIDALVGGRLDFRAIQGDATLPYGERAADYSRTLANANSANLTGDERNAYLAWAREHPGVSVAQWQATTTRFGFLKFVNEKNPTVATLRKVAQSVGLDVPEDEKSIGQVQLWLAEEHRDHPGLVEAIAALPARERFDADAAAQSVLAVDADNKATLGELVSALGSYRLDELKRVASAIRLPVPQRPPGGGTWSAEALRRYIAEAIMRDRSRWSLQ